MTFLGFYKLTLSENKKGSCGTNPIAVFIGGATLNYNFDFTQTDVKLFLEGTADFDNLNTVWTQDVVFRIVVVPADNVSSLYNPEITDFNLSNLQQRH